MTGTRHKAVRRGNGKLGAGLLHLGIALNVPVCSETFEEHPAEADAILLAVRRWSTSHLRRRFASGRSQLSHDVCDDAIQHLSEAILSGRSRLLPPPVMIAWCRRVLDNFVLDEIRRSARHCEIEGDYEANLDPWMKLETTELARLLVDALRQQAVRAAGPARAEQRKALLEAYLSRALAADPGPTEHQERALWQRRVSRGKQVAVVAWRDLMQGLEGQPSAMQELGDVANALGLGMGMTSLAASASSVAERDEAGDEFDLRSAS